MCKKQTSVSHSSTESEIISLDAGLRLDGLLALELWDLIVLVLGNTTQNHDRKGKPVVCRGKSHVQGQSRGMFNFLNNVDFVSSNVQFSHQEALLYVFEDNEAVIKIIIKGKKSHNETCFQDPKSCPWLVIRSNQFGPKNPNQVHWHQKPTRRHIDKGKFYTWWMESSFCVCHISSTDFSEVMSKRKQEESGIEIVTAKSRPMMSLIARAPSTLSSSASESPGKRSYESQSPLSMQAEKYDRKGKPVVGRDTSHEQGHHHQFVESTNSASCSGWDDDKAWSSQKWKADELMDDRTEKLERSNSSLGTMKQNWICR